MYVLVNFLLSTERIRIVSMTIADFLRILLFAEKINNKQYQIENADRFFTLNYFFLCINFRTYPVLTVVLEMLTNQYNYSSCIKNEQRSLQANNVKNCE